MGRGRVKLSGMLGSAVAPPNLRVNRDHTFEKPSLFTKDSISKMADYFLGLPVCIFTSVVHAFILVFSASKQAECFLVSVVYAFILVFSASKKAPCFLNSPVYFLIWVIHAIMTTTVV
jgi:hypothetical protein